MIICPKCGMDMYHTENCDCKCHWFYKKKENKK